MVKRALLCICFVLALRHAYGQDVITRIDGVVIRSTILDIQPTLIKFRLFNQPDTLVYQISPQDVQSVQMADGSVKNFSAATATQTAATTFNYETDLGRNILRWHILDLFFSNFTVSYEHILPSGKVGLRVPLFIGLAGKPEEGRYFDVYDFRRNNQFGAGLEVNYYTHGQGRLRYYLGPGFHFKTFQGYFFQGPANPQRPEPQPLVKKNVTMFALVLKNGVYYQLSKAFILSVEAGLGIRSFRLPENTNNFYYEESNTRAYVPANLLIGFRF